MFDKDFVRKRLRQKRMDAGLTIEALAKEVDVSKGTVSRWESGIRISELESLWRLADFYDISIDDLVGRRF